MIPLFGPIPGGPEMLVILLVLILLFGAQKIPKLARSTGQAIGEFRKGRQELEEELEKAQDDLEVTESSQQTDTIGSDEDQSGAASESGTQDSRETESVTEEST